MNLPPLILASASPRRSELLRQMGLEFKVIPSDATEVSPAHLAPTELAQLNAYRKARAVARQHPDALVLGVDTIVAMENQVFGKPATLQEAHRMLSFLQGHTHQVVSGVCLICLRARRHKLFAELTDVTFRRLTAKQIRHYHRLVNPLDKAGAYGIQENGDLIAQAISGSFTNVVGLPIERLQAELEKWQNPPP